MKKTTARMAGKRSDVMKPKTEDKPAQPARAVRGTPMVGGALVPVGFDLADQNRFDVSATK